MSKTMSLGAFLAVAAVSVAVAQTPKPAPEPVKSADSIPSVVKKKTSNSRLVVPENEFNFGYAPQNAKIVHNYWLKNAGPDSLQLVDVRPGCGCTKAPLKKKVLAAGDSTDVELVFSTGMYSSRTRKSASIIADAPHSIPNLSFSAFPTKNVDSLTPFVVVPPLLNLDSLKDQSLSGTIEVRVRNTSAEPISLKLVSAPSEYFTIDVPTASIAPGSDRPIRIHITSDISDTILAKSFTIEASDTAQTRYSVPIQKAMRWGPTTSSAN